MSDSSCCSEKTRTILAAFVGVLGSFLIIGGLAYAVVTQGPPAVDAAAAANRASVRAKVDQETSADLNKWAVDPKMENLARLGIDRAVEVFVNEWGQSSAEGRKKLLERLENSKKVASFE
jgi:hypothetical protein